MLATNSSGGTQRTIFECKVNTNKERKYLELYPIIFEFRVVYIRNIFSLKNLRSIHLMRI